MGYEIINEGRKDFGIVGPQSGLCVKQMWLGVKEMKQKRNKKITTDGEEVK